MSEIDDFLEELYIAAYLNEQDLGDVEPGYEYAVQQLCSEMIEGSDLFTKDDELDAMGRAQERVVGVADAE